MNRSLRTEMPDGTPTARQEANQFTLPRFWTQSIRNRLVVILLGFTIIPLILTAFASIPLIARGTRQQVNESLNAIGSLKENQIREWVNTLQLELEVEAKNGLSLPSLSILISSEKDSPLYENAKSRQIAIFRESIINRGIFEELFLLDINGQVILSTNPLQVGKYYTNQPLFQEGQNRRYLQPPTHEAFLGNASVFVTQPMVTNMGETIGVIAGRANLEALQTILSERTGLGQTGENYLIGVNKLLLSETLDPRYIPGYTYVRTVGAERAAQFNQIGTGSYQNYGGEVVIGNFRWIPELQIGLLTEQHEAEALSTLQLTTNATTGVTILAIFFAILAAFIISQNFTNPLSFLTRYATEITRGKTDQRLDIQREDEIGALADAFNRMVTQTQETIDRLELGVVERTQELNSRSEQLTAAAEVGRTVTTILDINQLTQQVVELILQRFNLYYVGLFLVDEGREWAILRAGTGRAGQAMIQRGHRLRVGEGSMIGWSIANAQARVALEAAQDSERLATPDLPETRSEAAIPLRSRGQVVGALSVQSRIPGAFDQNTINVFQTMADQVGVAIDNARLFSDVQAALEATQQIYGQLSYTAWLERLKSRPVSLRRDPSGIKYLEQAENLNSPLSENGDDNMVIPIKARGHTIGHINAKKRHKTDTGKGWRQEEVVFLETLIDELGIALDSARLFEETQQQAERERLIGEVTTRMRAMPDIQVVLQTAARELRKALNLEEVEIRLGDFGESPSEEPTEPLSNTPQSDQLNGLTLDNDGEHDG